MNKEEKKMLESCLPAGLLESYALGALEGAELDRVLDHLADCPLCRRRFEILTPYFSGPAGSYSGDEPELSGEVPAGIAALAGKAGKVSPRPEGRPPVPAPGQVWLVRPRPEADTAAGALAVLLPAVGGAAPVRGAFPAAILSWETELAGEEDLIIAAGESTLGLEFMVETWNRIYIPAERLERFSGRIRTGTESALRGLLSGRGEREGARTGPPVESLDDFRVFFQSRELGRAEGVEAAAEELARAAGRKKTKAALAAGLRAAHFINPALARKQKRKSGPEDFYKKYIRLFLPLAGALAIPIIANLFFKKLARALEKAQKTGPRKPEPGLLLGLSYCGLGKWEPALRVFAAVMGHPAALFAGLVFSAWVLSRKGEFRQAGENIRRARQLPAKAKTFEIDFDRIERFIEEEREAEFKEWFDREIASVVCRDPAQLLSPR